MEQELVKMGSANLAKAEQIKALLKRHDIQLEILLDKDNCGAGCSLQVDLWIRAGYLSHVQEILSREYVNSLQGLDVDFERINQEFDPEKENAICPACGHEFSTQNDECPECGLNFGS